MSHSEPLDAAHLMPRRSKRHPQDFVIQQQRFIRILQDLLKVPSIFLVINSYLKTGYSPTATGKEEKQLSLKSLFIKHQEVLK